jgi:hypothetical protein
VRKATNRSAAPEIAVSVVSKRHVLQGRQERTLTHVRHAQTPQCSIIREVNVNLEPRIPTTGGITLFLLILLSTTAMADELAPFTTDGCSSYPDGTYEHKRLWKACCVAHDYAYWQGGTRDQRRVADAGLRSCIANLGKKSTAALMHFGVRIGGAPYFPTKFRWGYGWEYYRGYGELSPEELKQAQDKLELFSKESN